MKDRSLVAGLGIAVLLVALIGCGGSQSIEGTTPNGADGGASVPPTSDGDPGEAEGASQGAQLVAERCTVCHNMGPIENERLSREQWLPVVNDMIARGARLDDEERDIVVEYLGR